MENLSLTGNNCCDEDQKHTLQRSSYYYLYIFNLTKAKNKASVRATLNCAKCIIMISTAVIA